MINIAKKIFLSASLLCLSFMLVSCATTPPPQNPNNLCSIFQQYPDWYQDAKNTEKKWGVPVAVQMAIINQESSFTANARPPRRKLLWIIPWKRQSTAYGYCQALKNTWKDYENHQGGGSPDAFADATDFIGWYSSQAYKTLHIRPTNAYALYLAYHEGTGGYAKRSYLKKPWLIRVARKVSNRAATYQRQLTQCRLG